MASALQEIFPGLNDDTAKALSWQGLQETTAWASLQQTDPAKAALYNQINIDHRSGSIGTNCN